MTIEEIQEALAELVAAMVEKGIKTPHAQLHVMDSGKFALHADCAYDKKPFDGRSYFVEQSGTATGCFDKARAYIAALPSPEDQITQQYLGKVADAIDYGTKHSIDDKYVTPLRGVTKQMTDNLLTKEPAQ